MLPAFACPQIYPNLQVVSPQKFWTLLKRLTGNLHIIPYQLTKFQVPSSNTFRDTAITAENKMIFFLNSIR